METRRLRVLSLFLAVLMLCTAVFPASAAESATAATIQLMKTEGTVSLTNSSGRSLTKRDNMRLYNGYHVETKAKSYAWVNLDDKKLTKLDAVSKVEVRKSGKKLELHLKSGNLFFNVTKPLEDDETLNIRTSTMMVGIRGTSGWVKILDRWTTEIHVLEGTVQISVTDPVTGQIKTAVLRSGETAIAAVYPQDREGDRCDIIQDRFTADDIDGFVLEELAQNPGLCGDIYEKSGMDPLPPIGVLESVRRQLEDIRKELQDVREQLQGENPSIDTAQSQLDELQQRLEDVRDQLEQAGPVDAARRRLDEAREHLEQAQKALDDAAGAQQQGGDAQPRLQEVLGRLDDAREDLEGAQQAQAADAQRQGEETARKRLEQDQQEMQERLDRAEEQLAGQENNVSTDPVWGTDSSESGNGTGTVGSSSGGGSSGGGSSGGGTTDNPTNPSGENVTRTLPISIADLQALLNDPNISGVTLEAGDSNELDIDAPLTVPGGKTLALSNGVNAEVAAGASLTVNGTMTGNTLTNNGDIEVNSGNTLDMQSIVNRGTLENTAKGRIVADTITTTGALTNAGRIEGSVEVGTNGTFTMTGGEVVSESYATLLIGTYAGAVRIQGGIVTNKSEDGFAIRGSSGFGSLTISGSPTIRAKTPSVTTAGESDGALVPPDGYTVTGPDGEGYYNLVPEGSGGPDTPEGAIPIRSAEDLAQLAQDVNSGSVGSDAYYYLTTDINLNSNQWTPIGTPDNPFTATFDGRDYEISGMYVDNSTGYKGLFGYVGEGGVVKSLGVIDGWVNNSSNYTGGIAAYNNGGTIENCHYTGSLFGGQYTGGIAGYNENGTVKNCYNTGSVSSTWESTVGGVVGYNNNGAIENCHNTGSVESRQGNGYVGGVAAYSENGTITNCYNTGSVDASFGGAGGVVGYNASTAIESSYNTGSVKGGGGYTGGVAGYNGGSVTNCYNTGYMTRQSTNISSIGGVVGENYGRVENCYNTGNVDATGNSMFGVNHTSGVVSSNYSTVENCYYLQTDEINNGLNGIGDNNGSGSAARITAEQFTSGEVAWLLQNGQDNTDVQVWGQTAGSGIPELTDESSKKVLKVTFMFNDEEYAVRYANPGGTVTLPGGPPEIMWYDETNTPFTAGTPVTEDMTVTGQAKFEASGAIGENVYWEYSDGTLRISGTGGMDSYANGLIRPWDTYRDQIETVIIEDGVTSIGNYAFADHVKLSSVTIPGSVGTIERNAFQSCISLTSLDIPDGVVRIEGSAFYACSSLKSMTLPASVGYIGISAFHGCTALTDVYYAGSETDWRDIDDNSELPDSAIHYNSTGPDDPSNYAAGEIRAAVAWEPQYGKGEKRNNMKGSIRL